MENLGNANDPKAQGGANFNPNFQQPPKNLPNAEVVLVVGILSIVSCWCYGFPGMILGVVGLVLGVKAKKLYNENPAEFTESSFKNANAGYICSIIGLILSVLYIIILLVIFGLSIFSEMHTVPWEY